MKIRLEWLLGIALVAACGGKDDDDGGGDTFNGTTSGTPAGTGGGTPGGTPTGTSTGSETTTTTDTGTPVPPSPTRTTPTTGAGVALTSDGAIAVVANRTAGEITVMDVDLGVFPASGGIRITFNEPDAEPWAAVISGDDDTAFVVLRNSREVVRIDDLTGSPTLHGVRAATDAEPSSIAISPNGSTLYVANWGAGNVSVIDTATMAGHTVDLNQALLDSGTFGDAVTASRPGLARPYALTVTNDGDADDDDETIFATEFFAQDLPSATFVDDSFFDTNKQGFVYWFDGATETVGAPISLAPSADMGFVDSNGAVTGCFPNQLYATALDGDKLYVAGTCASPRGPAAPGAVDKVSNFKTKVQTVLYVVDTAGKVELEGEKLHLNALWEDEYVADGFLDDNSRRYPLLVNNLAFVPGTHIAYMTAYGADAMFRVELDGSGNVFQVGSNVNKFVNLAGATNVGRLPYGIAVTSTGNAVIVNEHSRNLSVVDLGTQSVESVIASASPVDPTDLDAVDENEGKRFFVTGMGRWSYNGQGWNSCEGCHPHGLTDNVTWFFAAGPRQTTSLDASYDANGEHRIFNWTAIFDEVADFELNTRGISGGVGAVVVDATAPVVNDDRIVFDGGAISGLQIATDTLQNGLNGSVSDVVNLGVPGHDVALGAVIAQSVLEDWNQVDVYVRDGVRAPNAPELDAAKVAAGAALFTTHGCNGCHGGTNWTISERFYTPSQATNDSATGTLGTTVYARGSLPVGLNPPSDATGTAFLRAGGAIQCVLRSVGTFPATGTVGVAPAGVTVSERKDDMVSTAAGLNGFNPPSLLGASAGAPYFHAGNARTLEEVLDPTFIGHYRAFSSNFTPSAADIENLVAYLQSVDETAATETTSVAAIDTILCE